MSKARTLAKDATVFGEKVTPLCTKCWRQQNTEGQLKIDERDREEQLLERCAQVGRGTASCTSPSSPMEANAFRVAGLILRSKFPDEASRLLAASQDYFDINPDELVETAEALRRSWVPGLPRFRDLLSVKLTQGAR
ncbi:hypothetical protein [Thalassospira lucentensis]|uniref:hypothetical protein n=1 Tax=Thalassospira lucentensis TaxID=168935 RepID=UPI003D2C56EB